MSIPSIRRRLITRLVIGAFLLASAIEISIYLFLRGELIEQYDSALATKARAVAGILGVSEEPHSTLTDIAGSMRNFRIGARHGDYFQIWSEEGTLIMRSPSLEGADLPRSTDMRHNEARSESYMVTLPGGRIGRATEMRVPIISDAPPDQTSAAPPRWLRLVVATDNAELSETLLGLALALAGSSVIISIGTVAIVVYVVRNGLQPLHKLSRDVGQIEVDTLTRRIAVEELPQELQTIGAGLNALLGRLESAFGRERRFNADVAHELRTPLSEMRSIAEVALKWPPDQAESAKNYANILHSASRMADLVNALFAVVRYQSGRQTLVLEATSLRDAVINSWNPHAQQAVDRGLVFHCNVHPDIEIPADRTVLVAMLSNLFSNATTYATPSTQISCTHNEYHPGNNLILSICNESEFLSPDDLPHIDEPFWRKDASRTDTGHSGLGLTLVKQYANAMGICCQFTLRKPHLFCVELIWPGALTATPNPSAIAPDLST